MTQIIREMILDEEVEGVKAISLVTDPAILKNFVHFNEQVQLRTVSVGKGKILNLDNFFKYTASPNPETISTSHEFCKLKAGNVFHISEIKGWDSKKSSYTGFIDESNFFRDFKGLYNSSFNIDEQLYNCRHHFQRVRRLAEVPAWKQQRWSTKAPIQVNQSSDKQTDIQFKVNKERREIAGPALIPNMMIYRKEIGDTRQDGYVWLSAKTIKAIKEQYGYNRTLTIEHEADITGRAILLDSWIYPEENDEHYDIEVPEGTWFLRYKIIDNQLWEVIKDRDILGFSIEGMFNLKDPSN